MTNGETACRTFMMIDKIRPGDVEQVAILHQTYMNRGFLATLGVGFLEKLYAGMVTSDNAFCIVARDGARDVGFVSGTKHVSRFYKEFIVNNFFSVVIILLPKIFNAKTVKKVVETLVYPMKKEASLPDAELLSIVVEESYRVKGVSKELFNLLVHEFASRHVNRFKVVVGADLAAACRFYEKMGGVLHSEIEVHQGIKSRVYVWGME